MAKTDVAKVEPAPPVALTVPDALATALLEQAGAGLQDIGREDFAIPFLKVLQGLSPEVTPGTEKFIAHARQGDFVNSVTGEVFPGTDGVSVIRCGYAKKFLEWRPRNAGGGLVHISDTLEAAKAIKEPDIGNPNVDTEIVETVEIYLLVLTKQGWQQALLALKKTHLAANRLWNALLTQQTTQAWGIPGPVKALPVHGVVYKLTTGVKKNKKGIFFVPQAAAAHLADLESFKLATEFVKVVAAGKVVVKRDDDDPPAPTDMSDGDDVPGAEVGY